MNGIRVERNKIKLNNMVTGLRVQKNGIPQGSQKNNLVRDGLNGRIFLLGLMLTWALTHPARAQHKEVPDTLLQKASTSVLDSVTTTFSKTDSGVISLKKSASVDSAGVDKVSDSLFVSGDRVIANLTYKRVIENKAFDVGEKLTFVIRYGPVVAGTAIMAIPEITVINGVNCYHVVSEAYSNKFFSMFYKVRDRVESFIDIEGIFSWRFEKHLREGNFKADRVVDYDQINHLAITSKDTMKVPPFVQDVLSSLYYVRTQRLEVGKPISIDNHTDNKLYPLEVKVHRKERVKVRAGTFDCIVVEPILKAAGIFQHKGKLTVWLTDDNRKIPVLMKSKIIIGSIIAELEKMEGI